MGYNTTIFILNDRLSDIQRNPQAFVDGIAQNLSRGGNILGQTTVMPSEHADYFRLYATHRNSIVELSKWAEDTMHRYRASSVGREYIRGMVDQAFSQISSLREALDFWDAADEIEGTS